MHLFRSRSETWSNYASGDRRFLVRTQGDEESLNNAWPTHVLSPELLRHEEQVDSWSLLRCLEVHLGKIQFGAVAVAGQLHA